MPRLAPASTHKKTTLETPPKETAVATKTTPRIHPDQIPNRPIRSRLRAIAAESRRKSRSSRARPTV
jgi:hypothetical protein